MQAPKLLVDLVTEQKHIFCSAAHYQAIISAGIQMGIPIWQSVNCHYGLNIMHGHTYQVEKMVSHHSYRRWTGDHLKGHPYLERGLIPVLGNNLSHNFSSKIPRLRWSSLSKTPASKDGLNRLNKNGWLKTVEHRDIACNISKLVGHCDHHHHCMGKILLMLINPHCGSSSNCNAVQTWKFYYNHGYASDVNS